MGKGSCREDPHPGSWSVFRIIIDDAATQNSFNPGCGGNVRCVHHSAPTPRSTGGWSAWKAAISLPGSTSRHRCEPRMVGSQRREYRYIRARKPVSEAVRDRSQGIVPTIVIEMLLTPRSWRASIRVPRTSYPSHLPTSSAATFPVFGSFCCAVRQVP